VADLSQRLVVAYKSDAGLKRQTNEDACDYRIPAPNSAEAHLGALFVVADGVGSLGAGDQASRAAIDTLLDTYYDPELDDDDPRERLIAAIQDANEAVRARSRSLDAGNIGTTLAGVVVLAAGRALIFHVGDSRVYRLRGAHMERLTTDHSAVDPASHSRRTKLTSYIGQAKPILPGISEQTLHPADTLVLCSDGLWGLVSEDEIAAQAGSQPLESGVQRLIERVYANGARDNVTVMLVQYREGRPKRRLWLAVALLIVALAVTALASRALSSAPSETPVPPTEVTAAVEVLPTATEPASGQLIVRTATASPSP
jgi:protein phosphatase